MADVAAGSFGAAALDQPHVESTAPTTTVLRSAYDTAYGVIARRSERAAQIVRENESVRSALRTATAFILDYCASKAVTPFDIVVSGSMSPEGVIMLHIQRKDELS